MTQDQPTALLTLSEGFADAVERAAVFTVAVDGRPRLAASGIAWAADVVVTADHALERDEEVTIGLPDGTEASATIVGRDPAADIAVLRVAGPKLVAAPRRVAPLRVGSLVVAVGRPGSGGVQGSLGMVSALGGPWRTRGGRRFGGSIRTDTTFFPGFSGGPLIDAAGEVAGMNTSRFGRGAPITLPIAAVATVVEALLAHGRIRRGYLGIGSQPARLNEALQAQVTPPQESGLLIVAVEAESPAERGGLLVGDIMVGIDGAPIRDTGDLQAQLDGQSVGQVVVIRVLRGGKAADVTVTVGERE
jgi:S1-C subfamily serine protease